MSELKAISNKVKPNLNMEITLIFLPLHFFYRINFNIFITICIFNII